MPEFAMIGGSSSGMLMILRYRGGLLVNVLIRQVFVHIPAVGFVWMQCFVMCFPLYSLVLRACLATLFSVYVC
jgi:hypothetical protein